ncbi:MAG: hypothetical protein LBQ61_00385 [Spirochaetales bacterium]|jgi:hypothetical protein|nr:hypothetical protein [Spirochaetales bacterium]
MRFEGRGKPEGCKLLRVGGEVEDGRLKTLRLRGDFFAYPAEGFERAEARLTGVPLGELAGVFDREMAAEGVECQGITGRGLAEVIEAALKSSPREGRL